MVKRQKDSSCNTKDLTRLFPSLLHVSSTSRLLSTMATILPKLWWRPPQQKLSTCATILPKIWWRPPQQLSTCATILPKIWWRSPQQLSTCSTNLPKTWWRPANWEQPGSPCTQEWSLTRRRFQYSVFALLI